MTLADTTRRAALLLALLAPFPGLAFAAKRKAIKGIVSLSNFDALASFVSDQLDKGPFGMDVFVPNDAEGFTAESSDPLVIYRNDVSERSTNGGGDAIQLSAQKGYRSTGKGYYFGGLYKAEYAGLHQGISAIILRPVKTGQAVVDEINASDSMVELN